MRTVRRCKLTAPTPIHDSEKSQEIAFLYVNVTGYNAMKAYKLWCDEHGQKISDTTLRNASRYIHKPEVQEWILKYQAENRARYSHMRDINIQNLYSISTDMNETASNRIAATKELNSMFGYNQHNLSVDANASIEVVIE